VGNVSKYKTSLYDRYVSRVYTMMYSTDRAILRENLYIVTTILEDQQLFFWLSEGTALGALREGDIIKNDTDVDIGMFECDKKKYMQCLPLFEQQGFRLMRYYNANGTQPGIVSLYRQNHYIDIDFVGEQHYCAAFPGPCKDILNVLEPFQIAYIQNRAYYIPSLRYIQYLYGKDWIIPKKEKPTDVKR